MALCERDIEEQESALVERVRTWFASVFDEVDENVIVAVTHSDWIKLALRYLDVRKPWVVPRNSEIFPVIVEDVRTSIPGWKKRRDSEKEDIKKAEAIDDFRSYFVIFYLNCSIMC